MLGQTFLHRESSPTRTSQGRLPPVLSLHVVCHPVVALEAAHAFAALVIYVLVPHVLCQVIARRKCEITSGTGKWKGDRKVLDGILSFW